MSKGCKKTLAAGQYWNWCGETDMGQTAPALCTKCGGDFELEVLKDAVNHPDHYRLYIDNTYIEATDVIREALGIEGYMYFLRGNILKYHIRANKKGGEEDIQKANFYSRILEDLLSDSA